MYELFLTILLTTTLFIIFRSYPLFNINLFQAVVFNYITCVITGLIFSGGASMTSFSGKQEWLYFAIIAGFMFIGTFYLIGYTVRKVSVTVATIANKISLVIPVLFSILIFNDNQTISKGQIAAILLGISAIVLSSWKNDKKSSEKGKGINLVLPFIIFVMGGLIDTLLNYVNEFKLDTSEHVIFPIACFGSAAFAGSIVLLIKIFFQGEKLHLKSIVAGIILGIPNYFSIYFLLKSLSAFNHDGSFIFPVMNIGVIVLSAFISLVVFKDRLSGINIIGILLALIALLLFIPAVIA